MAELGNWSIKDQPLFDAVAVMRVCICSDPIAKNSISLSAPVCLICKGVIK